MTTKDQKSDSKPSEAIEDAEDIVSAAKAQDDAETAVKPEPADAADESEEQPAGFFPPVPDSIEQVPGDGVPAFGAGSGQPGPFTGPQGDGPGPFVPGYGPGDLPNPFAPGSNGPGEGPNPFAGGPGGPGEGPNPFAPQGPNGNGGPDGPNPFAPTGGPFPQAGPYGGPGPFAGGPGDGPFAAGPNGPFPGAPQPGFPTGAYPPPDAGQFAPPPNSGAPGAFQAPGGSYGEIRQETPYGEIRQEIGSDGMVRRVFPEQPADAGQQGGPGQQGHPGGQPGQSGGQQPGGPGQFQGGPENTGPQAQFGAPGQPGQFAPSGEQPGGPIYSWSPPPAQPQPQQQPGFPPGWNNQGQPGFGQQQPGYGQNPPPGHSVNDLNLLKRARRAPRSGWRRAVHKMSGGSINPGESPADVVHSQLADRVNQPVRGDYRIAILSLKGGVGKTTTTVGLGSTFSSLRGDRVIAIDANPDLGTLAHRVPRQTRSTVRNLLEDNHISRYSDVRAHTSQAPSRLEVLASEQDPAVSEAFSEADYRKAIGILQQFYNIILTDCGTGLMHSAMAGVLDMASSLVLVTSPAIDGARSASATLDWLDHHGYHKLVERTVVVVNASRKGSSTVDLDQLRKLFLDRTRAVQVVPFDDHLAEGAEIDLELVSKPTRRALLELAAMVADDFGYHAAQQGYPQQPR
ncbi:MinD/ParA family ATP-binding protein [Nocardia inohanensis]|uniref:MinD/ParA family ATP-binding protein n=1 Tax=Nocardia inohanensis TaxID=209246 RepID=UPI000A8F017A|nr:MinD/ParA family protein [Nocardia inohanensis]